MGGASHLDKGHKAKKHAKFTKFLKQARAEHEKAKQLTKVEKEWKDEAEKHETDIKELQDNSVKYIKKWVKKTKDEDGKKKAMMIAFFGLCEVYVLCLFAMSMHSLMEEIEKEIDGEAEDDDEKDEMRERMEEEMQEGMEKIKKKMGRWGEGEPYFLKLVMEDIDPRKVDEDGEEGLDQVLEQFRRAMGFLKEAKELIDRKVFSSACATTKRLLQSDEDPPQGTEDDPEGIHVNVKTMGTTAEKLLFRHPVLTDVVRTMIVVEDKQYEDLINSLLDHLSSTKINKKGKRTYLKPGMGQRVDWPYPFVMEKIEVEGAPLDNMILEMQFVPLSAYQKKSKSHATLEKGRVTDAKKAFKSWGLPEDEFQDFWDFILSLDIFSEDFDGGDDSDEDSD